MFAILDFGNYQFSEDPIIRNTVHLSFFSMNEYQKINRLFSLFIMVMRISLGSFDYGAGVVLDPFRNNAFWIIWLIQVTVLKVVFLNFIIAEVTNSY